MRKHILPIDSRQAEKLSELGYRLHQFRQKQHIPLEQVAARTMIPTRTLAAIEAGDFDQLPEPIYIQGFIRRYADAIGMDGIELANAFPAQAPLKTFRPSWRGTVQAQLRPLHLYLLYMALVVSAVSGLSYLMHRSSVQLSQAPTTQTPTQLPLAVPGLPKGPALPSQKGGATALGTILPQPIVPVNESKSVQIGLTLTSQSWIRVVADGKLVFEDVLPEGTQRKWEADKQLVLRAGNAGGVMISLNGGESKRFGEPGSVEEATFGKNSDTQAVNPSQATVESSALTASR